LGAVASGLELGRAGQISAIGLDLGLAGPSPRHGRRRRALGGRCDIAARVESAWMPSWRARGGCSGRRPRLRAAGPACISGDEFPPEKRLLGRRPWGPQRPVCISGDGVPAEEEDAGAAAPGVGAFSSLLRRERVWREATRREVLRCALPQWWWWWVAACCRVCSTTASLADRR
jgi:hypothetical protein